MMKKQNLKLRKEKIVEVMKKKYRLYNVLLKDMYIFAKKHIDPNIKSNIRKSELLPMVTEYLTGDTLMEYVEELPRFGLARCDLPEALDITMYQADQLIKSKRLKLLNVIKWCGKSLEGYDINVNVYSIADAISAEEDGILNHHRKK